jgi:DNA-binding winged helix-turn-helix (wHTH) protein/predicted ATPase
MMGQDVTFGRHRFHPDTGRLWSGKREVKLTPKAAAVLTALIGGAGHLLTREALLASVWGDAAVGDEVLTTCIRELREALDDDARRPRFIETRHRRGYRFVARLTEVPPPTRVVSPRQPFVVGRDDVLGDLRQCLTRARAGERQIVFVTGEPGVGKTTVVEAFLADAADREAFRLAYGVCVEHYGAGEPYLPLMEALTRLCREREGPGLVRLLRQHAPTWLAQMPSVVTPAELRSLQRQASSVTRERMLRELAEVVEVVAREVPLVLWLEDLHWSDVSTLDWLASMARRPEVAKLLLLGSYRSGEGWGRGHPLDTVKDELDVRGHCREIAVSLLDEPAIGGYLARRFPSVDPLDELARTIHRRTGGNPLFVASVSDELVRRGVLVEGRDGWALAEGLGGLEDAIPDDVRRMITLQLDRLAPAERLALESSSAAGAVFSAAATAAGADISVEEAEAQCAGLARRESFLVPTGSADWPDGTVAGRYAFRHALHRDVVYQRIPPARRAETHRRIGERLEAGLGASAGGGATELAMHFEQGREFGRAIHYLRRAGEIATQRGASQEAVVHLTRALELLSVQPDAPERAQQELVLQIALGGPLMAVKGRGTVEVEQVYTRAQELSQRAGDAPQLFTALWGLFLFRRSRGEIDTAAQLARRLLGLAQRTDDSGLLLEAHHAMWATCFARGDLVAARDHAAEGIALYHADRHASLAATYGNHDPGVCGHAHRAWALELLGESTAALRHAQEAIALARTVSHRFSEAHALLYAARLHQLRGDWRATREHADEGGALAREGGFVQLLAWADVARGWALAEAGDREAGLATIRAGVAAIRASGSKDFLTYFLAVLAESLTKAGRVESGLGVVAEALAAVEASGERFYAAELHRLRGELLLAADRGQAEVADCFRTALQLARSQGARRLEHRALASLGALAGDPAGGT